MTHQILIGVGVIAVSIIVHSVFISVAVSASRALTHNHRPFFLVELMIIALAVLWMLLAHATSILMWTEVLRATGAMATFEDALYFTMVCYTTLGLGGMNIATEWRLLPGLMAANGFLLFGFTSAFAVDIALQLKGAPRKT